MNNNETFSPYCFAVELDNIQVSNFKSCSGLEIYTDVVEIEEGGYNLSTRKFLGQTHYQNIILEQGIANGNDLYNWYHKSALADNERERKNGSIVLLNPAGKEIKRWNFFRAFPCRWVGPSLVAGLRGKYAIEKFEIAIEKIYGHIEVDPTYFTQDQWVDDINTRFANEACAATSLLNEISEEYTEQTGRAMTQEQGAAAMRAAVNAGAIRRTDANVGDWQEAETAMWNSTGAPGSLVHNERPDAEHTIYAVNRDNNPNDAEHFVNSAADGQYHDPWNGNRGNTDELNLEADRPTRGFDYEPPEETN